MKNILFATSEAVPFIKTGGLADVAGSLPKYFDKRYFDIRVILPKYACMKQEWKDKMNYITHFYMDLGYKNCYVGIMHMEYEGIQFYFIDNEYYFSGPKPYDGGTWDLEKFAFFSKAVLSVLPVIGFRPDIIHCHDWQTGLVPVYLHDSFQQNEFFWNIKTIMTIHNLKFQGVWDVQTIKNITGLSDYPETDPYITKTYNATTFRKEKVKNKLQLQRDLGLQEDPKTMMIGIVSRLTDQKGFDLIAYVMDELCQDAIQLVILGTGDERYENMFRHFDWKYHGKVSAQIYYDEKMSHRIYASADAFLMPSLFEPCGLSQLMSLRYGTLPIVRETGGLKDTVVPYNEYEGTGNGFSFRNYNAHEMLATVRNAERIYYDKKREWNKMVDRAMAADFSWGNSARQYEEMYNWLIGDK